MGARGPARYYRGEDLAAEALRAVHPDARIGIADRCLKLLWPET
jgi:hypothetical protein